MRVIRPAPVTDTEFVSSNIAENDHSVYSASTTYVSGDKVIVLATHRIYESQQNSNTGNDPTDTGNQPVWWLDIGPTNRWAVFDQVVGTQSEKSTQIEHVIDVGIVDSVALLNMDATSATVIVTSTAEGEVYNNTIDLDESDVYDWYSYFFEPFSFKTDITLFNLPPYGDAEIKVQINKTGTAKCGGIIAGLGAHLGTTQHGVTSSIQDFSRKEADDFGNYDILERSYSKRVDVELFIDNVKLSSIHRTLASLRATPAVYTANETTTSYSPLVIYGFYRDFSIHIEYAKYSYCNLEIEGLT